MVGALGVASAGREREKARENAMQEEVALRVRLMDAMKRWDNRNNEPHVAGYRFAANEDLSRMIKQ